MTPLPRPALLRQLFPDGLPTLWCPPITHYDADGGIDRQRLAAHLRHLVPHVKGFLIPGSTGDGWEMDEAEIRGLLECALDQCAALNARLLIGVLKTDAAQARQCILDTVEWLKARTGETEVLNALRKAHVSGFTICPPTGRELSQEQITAALATVLELGVPASLYQLPQVTQNEMAPATVAQLAHCFPNFILFKDTSGNDRVAQSGLDLGGVFLVRGAEGDYARWLKSAGGPYDGFLLSTANCFARELHRIQQEAQAGHLTVAHVLSDRLTRVVNEVFQLAAAVPHGNAFANANKAMDHFLAHGPAAGDAAPPRLHAGTVMPADILHAAGQALQQHGFLPAAGYLD